MINAPAPPLPSPPPRALQMSVDCLTVSQVTMFLQFVSFGVFCILASSSAIIYQVSICKKNYFSVCVVRGSGLVRDSIVE